ncbi:MAG: histidine phosphatase family protein [Acidobacteriota bacterium]|nr:histidine phosphatase family protein [Acidobacteriota bacterium]
MKTLFLLRHAKSSWDDADNLADFDRPLNTRGLDAVPLVGEKIFDNQFQIDLIISSPAKRAKQTAILIKETAQIKSDVRYDDKIYEASPRRLLEVIAGTTDEGTNSVMLVGHNPGLEGLIKALTRETQAMKTAALAVIDLKIEHWSEIGHDCGHIRKIFNPKSEREALEESW